VKVGVGCLDLDVELGLGCIDSIVVNVSVLQEILKFGLWGIIEFAKEVE
jgi:hypothetical protein